MTSIASISSKVEAHPSRVPGRQRSPSPFAGRSVAFDLTVEGHGLAADELDRLPGTTEELALLDRAARLAILRDARSGDDDSAAMLYITHHHDVLPRPDFVRLFGTDTPDLAEPEPLLSRMVLVRVGLYPENQDQPFLLDYSIDPGYALALTRRDGGRWGRQARGGGRQPWIENYVD